MSANYGASPVTVALDSVMSVVHQGHTETKTFSIHGFSSFGTPADMKTLTVLLNSKGEGTPFLQPECDTTDNTQVVRSPLLFNDAATVQAYRWVEIDVLANDSLPAGYFAGAFSLLDSIVMQPRNGTLSVAGSGATSRLIYHNTGTANLINQIDSFRYALTYLHPELGLLRRTATVYIYVLEDMEEASACYGQTDYVIRLRQRPPGVMFYWYYASVDPSVTSPFLTSVAYNPGAPTGDSTWRIRPVDPNASARWNRTTGGFPAGLFTLHVAAATPASMRWTGEVSSDWRDPRNWV